MMRQGDPIFIDSNVIIHVAVKHSPCHQKVVQTLDILENNGALLYISRQVLREYLVYVTRPQVNAKPIPLKWVLLQTKTFLERFLIVEDNDTVTAELLKIIQSVPVGGKQIHDANIVATMMAYGIPNLLTYNVDDFRRFASCITIIDPQSL